MKRWSNSSLQVIDPKASAAPSWSGMMSATIPRSLSDPLDGQCMLTAVLRRCSSVRLSTAVQGGIASTMHDLAISIAAAHQYACAVSVQTCGSSSVTGGSPPRTDRLVNSTIALSTLRDPSRRLRNGSCQRALQKESAKNTLSRT